MSGNGFDRFESKERIYLGGRISAQHKNFLVLAKLGYEEAEIIACLDFFKWIDEHPKATLEETLRQAVILLGEAHFLPQTKELTRLSMILGDTRKSFDYE